MISSEDVSAFDNIVSSLSQAVLAGEPPARDLVRLRSWLMFQARPCLDDDHARLLDSAIEDLYSDDVAMIRRGLAVATAALGLSNVMVNVRFASPL